LVLPLLAAALSPPPENIEKMLENIEAMFRL
jgi:hypothetical protein